MEEILNKFVQRHTLDEIVAGAPIDFNKVPDKNHEPIAAILLHCCINGPVSPHKVTNYPVIGEARLDDLANQKVSNNGLRKTCESIAKWLLDQGYDSGLMYNEHGGFWPLNSFSPG